MFSTLDCTDAFGLNTEFKFDELVDIQQVKLMHHYQVDLPNRGGT